MTLTPKEIMLLQDLRSQEQICVEKYAKYAADARDTKLKTLFTQIGQAEQTHLNSLSQMLGGTVPAMGGGAQVQAVTTPTYRAGDCSQDRQTDAFLCSDSLGTEKHVSSVYDTSIFEFSDVGLRNALNHIQKEEQQHGEKIYAYMAQNGMYN